MNERITEQVVVDKIIEFMLNKENIGVDFNE